MTYMKKILRPPICRTQKMTNGRITKFLDRKMPTKIPSDFVSVSR